MKRYPSPLLIAALSFIIIFSFAGFAFPIKPIPTTSGITQASARSSQPADAAIILSRKEVPVLCYHQIRDFKPTDSKIAKDYIVPIANFRAQLKMLADSGYHTIL